MELISVLCKVQMSWWYEVVIAKCFQKNVCYTVWCLFSTKCSWFVQYQMNVSSIELWVQNVLRWISTKCLSTKCSSVWVQEQQQQNVLQNVLYLFSTKWLSVQYKMFIIGNIVSTKCLYKCPPLYVRRRRHRVTATWHYHDRSKNLIYFRSLSFPLTL